MDTYQELPDIGLDTKIGDEINPWLHTYISYAQKVSPMTPTIFHESAALWLISLVVARRLCLPMSFSPIYPNIFICWIAPTTLWNKTTGLNIARNIAIENFPHLLAPQDMTPESFLSDLAGREPNDLDKLPDKDREMWKLERDFCSQRGLLLDELSGLMSSSKKDYNAGLIESMLRFYDCDSLYVRSTRSQGRIVVRNAYLTMIGASTPAAMMEHIGNEHLWSVGWWPRFGLLTPEDDVPEWKRAEEVNEPPEIRHVLTSIYSKLPMNKWPDKPEAIKVYLDGGVFDLWDKYNKCVRYDMIIDKDADLDERLYGTYGRSQIQALKLATLLAALDWHNEPSPIIKLSHITKAIMISEIWRKSAHRALEKTDVSEYDKIEGAVMRICTRFGSASMRDLHNNARSFSPTDIEDVINQLIKMGVVEAFYDDHDGKPGRPTTKYKIRG